MNRSFIRKLSPVALLSLLAVKQAHAALPTAVTTAITDAGADLSTAAAAVIVAMVAFWGLKKLGSKMGWF